MKNIPKNLTETTKDHLLKGRVTFHQPAIGYRTAIDTVLLAASVNAKPGDKVLDMGCGVGGAMLALGARVGASVGASVDGVLIDGIEIQPQLVGLAKTNILENKLDGSLRVFEGDIANPPKGVVSGGYDFVMANPPFMDAGRGNPPPGEMKRTANFEGDADLATWLGAGLKLVKRKGTVVIIQRADRLGHIMAAIDSQLDANGEGAGDAIILPIHPRAGMPANRVIVSFRRGVKTPVTLLEGIAVHTEGEGYTDLLEDVLDGGAISLK